MQQSRELLQQSLAAVPLRSPVISGVEESSEEGTNFRRALGSQAALNRDRIVLESASAAQNAGLLPRVL
jgi:hypothetical protein